MVETVETFEGIGIGTYIHPITILFTDGMVAGMEIIGHPSHCHYLNRRVQEGIESSLHGLLRHRGRIIKMYYLAQGMDTRISPA